MPWNLLMVCFMAVLAGFASAQTYPSRPVRLILPFAAGGGADLVARIVAQHLGDALGQTVVVDNRPGGGATIGTEMGAKAAPDGYTLVVGSSTSLSVNPVLMKVRYDALRDFVPITMLGAQPHIVVVHPSIPANSVREFIALAKASPRAYHYSSSGNGGPTHLGCELFKQATGIDIVHVPYKGQSASIVAVLSGETQFSMPSVASILPHVRSRKVRGLAATGEKRLAVAPDLPTLREEGYPDSDSTSWTGIFAPAGTPMAVVRLLQEKVAAMMRAPEVASKFAANGVEPGGNTQEEFAAYVRRDIAKWARVVKTAGIRVD